MPEPGDPPVTASHALEEDAVHTHPAGIVTATLPWVADAGTSALVGEMLAVQGTPAWVTVNVCPPTVSTPLRLAALVFAPTAYVTVPAPDPLPPADTDSHGTELVVVQLQPAAVVTPTVPVVASGVTVALTGEIA